MSDTVRTFCKMLGVEQIRISPYHPQINGMLEILEPFQQTLKLMLHMCAKFKKEWEDILPALLLAYHSTPLLAFQPLSYSKVEMCMDVWMSFNSHGHNLRKSARVWLKT